MKVENIRLEEHNGKPAVKAVVTWEDSPRPRQEIYFATLDRFADALDSGAAAYAVGCLLPALHHGERRLRIDGAICPELRDGLHTVMGFMGLWHEAYRSGVQIEADVEERPSPRPAVSRSALFFSGGIDSLAALRENHSRYPESHSGFFRDGILIYGQNPESDHRPETFEKAMAALSEVTRESGISLLPVYTNLRELDDATRFFVDVFHGAILGAVSHIVSGRVDSVSISASDSIPGLVLVKRDTFKPFGSHPLIDPYYSSWRLRIRHVGMTLGRLEKTRLVAQWPVALNNIRVCQPNWPGENCGQCEKCLRTMLALTAVGALDKTRSFPKNDMTVADIENIRFKPGLADDYRELIDALAHSGRRDLAASLRISLGRALGRAMTPMDLVRKTDKTVLHGGLSRLKKRLTGSRAVNHLK